MAEDRKPDTSQARDCNSPIAQTLGQGCETLLPQNDQAIVSDSEFLEHRKKLLDRSKLIFAWTSVSDIFKTISAPLILGGMGIIIGALSQGQPLNLPVLSAIFGASAVCLGVSIVADYFRNIVAMNQSFDRGDLDAKRYGTHLARALDEVEKEKAPEKKSSLADKLHPHGAAASWEEKTRRDPQAVSQSIN